MTSLVIGGRKGYIYLTRIYAWKTEAAHYAFLQSSSEDRLYILSFSRGRQCSMADPFAILSLVDTVFGLGCKVYEFFSAVQDAPLEIRSFANELFVLNSVLKEVKGYLKAFRTSSLSARDELHLDLVGVTLKQCNAELWDIYDAVKEKDSKQRLPLSKRLGSSSSWVLDRDERIKSTERLSRARDTLAIQTSLGYV